VLASAQLANGVADILNGVAGVAGAVVGFVACAVGDDGAGCIKKAAVTGLAAAGAAAAVTAPATWTAGQVQKALRPYAYKGVDITYDDPTVHVIFTTFLGTIDYTVDAPCAPGFAYQQLNT